MLEYLSTIAILVATALVLVLFYLKNYVFSYWKKYNVPHETPSIPLGNIPLSYILGYLSIGDLIKASYEKFKKHPFYGIYVFHKPILVVNDPELIKAVLIKDFAKFIDRGWFCDEKLDPLSNNIIFQPVEKWRRSRGKFSPTFTPQKLKNIQILMAATSNEMIKIMHEELKKSNTLEIMNIVRRYTTDIMFSVVYGLDSGSLKNAQSEFCKIGLKAADFGRMRILFALFVPEVLKKSITPFFKSEVKNFFVDIFHEVVDYRRKNSVAQKDMLNLLIQLVHKDSVEDEEKVLDTDDEDSESCNKISILEAVSQAFAFSFGGIDTSSLTVSYCLLEMGLNPRIQEKLQQEVDEVYESSEGVKYDSLMEMKYLEMVITETMRKYAPICLLNRMAVEDFPISGSDFVIPKGMRIVIPISGIHKDPTYFPDPEKFDPSRHAKEEVASRNPCVNLAFGNGPRDCIGKRFGVTQVKQAVVALLRHYNIRVSDKTKFPIKFSTETYIQQPANGIYLYFDKRIKTV